MNERGGGPSVIRMLLTLAGVVLAAAVGITLVVLGVGWLTGPAPGAPAVATASAPASAEATSPAAQPTTMTAVAPATPPTATVAPQAAPAAKAAPAPKTGYVVVIDAGHQLHGNNTPEPIGPGSSQTKPKVKSGAEGVVSPHVPEHTVNLQVSLKLRDILEKQGVKVVMVRTTEDVDIANSERAKIGNRAKADLVVRVHCDDLDSSSTNGFMTVIPDDNKWTHSWLSQATKAGELIQKAALAATGARDRGVKPPPEPMSGFNWSTVPSVIVEMGLMSNPAEDRKLTDPAYQDKLAQGIANGTMAYLRSSR